MGIELRRERFLWFKKKETMILYMDPKLEDQMVYTNSGRSFNSERYVIGR